jgi:HKD family nuclease
MLLTTDQLLPRLEELVEKADRIDMAVAWVSPCDALETILSFANRGMPLRAVVGTYGSGTVPAALRKLHCRASLRLAKSKAGIFHPKLYLFHCKRRCVAWFGSANLSSGGFQLNDELVLESVDRGDAADWFEKLWNSLPEDPSDAIDKYEENWKPPLWAGSGSVEDKATASEELTGTAASLSNWSSYVDAIATADRHWSARWNTDNRPVTGEVESWLSTIILGHEVVRRPSWDQLSREDRHILLGLSTYGLLGSMKGARGANYIFNNNSISCKRTRERIRRALRPVVECSPNSFAETACVFVRELEDTDNFGGAIATRFLALARPDLAISVNNGSRERLAKLSNLPSSMIALSPSGRRSSYRDLLQWFESQAWYTNPRPRNAYEKLLAENRTALFDAFVYKPTRKKCGVK